MRPSALSKGASSAAATTPAVPIVVCSRAGGEHAGAQRLDHRIPAAADDRRAGSDPEARRAARGDPAGHLGGLVGGRQKIPVDARQVEQIPRPPARAATSKRPVPEASLTSVAVSPVMTSRT